MAAFEILIQWALVIQRTVSLGIVVVFVVYCFYTFLLC